MGKRKKDLGFATRALRAGYTPSGEESSLAVPIYDTVAHRFLSIDDAAAIFRGEKEGYAYARVGNPTVGVFEKRMAALEGAEAGLGTSSGMAAIFLVAAYFTREGRENEIVSSDRLYGGTFDLFKNDLRRFGTQTRFVKDPHNLQAWESEITEHTRFLYVETPSNPKVEIFAIKPLADLAHRYTLPLVVDSTIATPALMRPIEFGADLVIHSATKYICGNSTALGGMVLGKTDTIGAMRMGVYRNIGCALSPFNADRFLVGLETLMYRMAIHSKHALGVAKLLEKHPGVKAVYYPGLKSSPFYELVRTQMHGLASSLMTFEIHGTRDNGARFIEALKVCSHAATLGDVKTLALHPASTSHNQLRAEDLEKVGISETLIRLSVGLEDPNDIIYDIKQALKIAFSARG